MSGTELILRRVSRGAWSGLPILLFASVAVCLAAALVVVLTPGVTPVSVLVFAALETPWAVALLATVDDLIRMEDTSLADWCRGLCCFTGFGYAVMAVPAVAVSLFLVALEVWHQTHSVIALGPVIVSAIVATILGTASTAALPLGIAHPQLRGQRLWITGMHLVARWPVRFLAAPALLGFGVWVATQVSASVLLLVPAPVALVLGAGFWTSAAELDPSLPVREFSPPAVKIHAQGGR
ncbi:hypothetical protein FOS14_17905 [Skermania sp. ID1734]|uniref:hypothetical protein n=1 Tax=Skermania sp. ID1734 TaxID=2597516 RepID=UPI00118007A7|nr:hypothetical protein [Skermania sp. ID1734]TSD95672.1 hypothetical protein FOS14_17905 [Skermania sp. ID1734]